VKNIYLSEEWRVGGPAGRAEGRSAPVVARARGSGGPPSRPRGPWPGRRARSSETTASASTPR